MWRAATGLSHSVLAGDEIVVAGHPHWDHVRATARSLRRADRHQLRRRLFGPTVGGRLVILFAAELSGGLDARQFHHSPEYSLIGEGTSHGRTEIVVEEFLCAVAPRRRDIHLVLRLHPKHRPEDLSAYSDAFDVVSRSESSLEVIHAADAVVGMTSMLMIEAALIGRPTLAILPRAQEAHWLPTIACGVTPCATTRVMVAEGVKRLLADLQPPDARMLDHLFPPGASERVLATIAELLSR